MHEKVKLRVVEDYGSLASSSLEYSIKANETINQILVANSKFQIDEDELDIVGLIESSYDDDTSTVRDLKIDDRDLPKAKNFFDFCSTKMGRDARMPFARQMWMGYTLLGEFCPRCSNPKWRKITGVPVDFKTKDMPEHVQFLENGKCPKCKATRSQLVKKGYLNLWQELDACVGQRGGKSAFTSALSAYLIHVFLKIPRLSKICEGIKEETPITGTFVGIRFTDAYNLLWTPIVEIIDASPWFADYHKLLDHYGEKYGKEIYKKKDVFIRYAHKNIELYPSGPTKRGLRGRTRFLGVIDELGWFPINKNPTNDTPSDSGDRERADAEEVHTSLDRSLLTVRTEVSELIEKKGYNTIPTGLQICVSSPSSRGDKIWRLVQSAKGSTVNLGIHLPTWEMSPRYKRNNKIIAEAYRTNPIIAERDYGANPPTSSSPFIEDRTIRDCFSGINRVIVELRQKEIGGKTFVAAKVISMNVPNIMPPSVLAIDAGYSGNSFGLTVGTLVNNRITVPVLIEVQPESGSVIHFNAMYNSVIVPLIKAFNVKFMFADRWQSISMLHRAQEEFKVQAIMYSAKRRDFDLTKSKMQDIDIQFPKIEKEIPDEVAVVNYPSAFKKHPAAHLYFQCLTVKDSAKTVLKGDGYTDDLFRAVVLLVSRLHDPKIKEQLEKMMIKKRESRVVGVVRGSSGNVVSEYTIKPVAAVVMRRLS